MKSLQRLKSIRASKDGLSVKITVETNSRDLSRDEADTLISHLADRAMGALNTAPFLAAPLSKIKVGGRR